MRTFVLRLWLPDRPGALGAVASRIGAVGGDVVGIEILERGTGCAIDELVVELPDDTLVELMLAEVGQVDGVDVEDVMPMAASLRDPRLDALETAAMLVGAGSPDEAVEELCFHASRTVGAEWGAVVALERGDIVASHGAPPSVAWLLAYVEGSRSSARLAGGGHGADDVVWAPLPQAGLALVLGRDRTPFRARERHQVSALARIVDTRYGELRRAAAKAVHPSAPA